MRDWKAVHEMVHLALPDLAPSHLWLAEGIAVYVELIARVEAGELTEAKIWGDFVRDMPQGLPQAGDRGLDNTPTWGLTYWGGAVVSWPTSRSASRPATGSGCSRGCGILAAGGTHEQDWPIERSIGVADTATGVGVLADLYEKMRNAPYAPDLDALWRDLGIAKGEHGVTCDDAAPLAAIRRAITEAPASSRPL